MTAANFTFSDPDAGGIRVVRCGDLVIGTAEEVEPGTYVGTTGSGAKTEPGAASQVAKALRALPQTAASGLAEAEAVKDTFPPLGPRGGFSGRDQDA